ncbi:MAG: DUF2269 domain-containing protein [Actinobacteria bacterium]|nr:DUF2269 domain-containing protein [Actinomycetota bacterium]
MGFEWSTLWLILHILSAIIGFGPTFVFGIVGAMVQKEPQHALFAVHLNEAIEKRLVMPAFTLLPIFGVALILSKGYDFFGTRWLLSAASIYLVMYVFGMTINRRVSKSIAAKVEGMVAGQGGPETVTELQALGKKAMRNGILLSIGFLIVLTLMVWKPDF